MNLVSCICTPLLTPEALVQFQQFGFSAGHSSLGKRISPQETHFSGGHFGRLRLMKNSLLLDDKKSF